MKHNDNRHGATPGVRLDEGSAPSARAVPSVLAHPRLTLHRTRTHTRMRTRTWCGWQVDAVLRTFEPALVAVYVVWADSNEAAR